MSITEADRTLCEARSTSVDYEAVPGLHFLGNYQRNLPISMARMMENAYDWEHLPFVHASSFADIDLIAEGRWGWRAKAEVPPRASGNYNVIELLVDVERNYWATTTLTGAGAGVQIHTQATRLGDQEIEIDVCFYLPEPPEKEEDGAVILDFMTTLYAKLYDEDIVLMSGREDALQGKKRRGAMDRGRAEDEIYVGEVADLEARDYTLIETPRARICVRKSKGEWIAYSADCPHMLGPLEEERISEDGRVTCPWHGYEFDVMTGKSCDGKCGDLAPAPTIVEREGALHLKGA